MLPGEKLEMPIEHWIEDEPPMLRVRRWGAIPEVDEDDDFKACLADPRVGPGIPVLVDCSDIDPPDDPHTIRHLADRLPRLVANLRCGPVALVVSSDVQYGMARMYMAYTDLAHPDTEVFRNLEEAREWLLAGGGAKGH